MLYLQFKPTKTNQFQRFVNAFSMFFDAFQCFAMIFNNFEWFQCVFWWLSKMFNAFLRFFQWVSMMFNALLRFLQWVSIILNNFQTFCIVFEASWGRGSPTPGGHFRAIGRLRRLVHPVSTRNPPGAHGKFWGSTFWGGVATLVLYQTTPWLGTTAVWASALAMIWNMKIQQKSITNNEISTRWWTKDENYLKTLRK